MVKLDLNNIHDLAVVEGRTVINKVTPALSLSSGPQAAQIFIQKGKTYGAGGEPIDLKDVDDWFWDEVEKCTPKLLQSVGFTEKRPRKAAEKEAA